MIPVLLGASFGSTPAVIITLSDLDVISANSAGMRVNIDGTIDTRQGAGPTYAQANADTDWIRPLGQAGSKTYHLRLNIVQAQMLGDTMEAWVELVDDLEWWHVSGGLTRTGTLLISDDGGSTTLDTAVVSFEVP